MLSEWLQAAKSMFPDFTEQFTAALPPQLRPKEEEGDDDTIHIVTESEPSPSTSQVLFSDEDEDEDIENPQPLLEKDFVTEAHAYIKTCKHNDEVTHVSDLMLGIARSLHGYWIPYEHPIGQMLFAHWKQSKTHEPNVILEDYHMRLYEDYEHVADALESLRELFEKHGFTLIPIKSD